MLPTRICFVHRNENPLSSLYISLEFPWLSGVKSNPFSVSSAGIFVQRAINDGRAVILIFAEKNSNASWTFLFHSCERLETLRSYDLTVSENISVVVFNYARYCRVHFRVYDYF